MDLLLGQQSVNRFLTYTDTMLKLLSRGQEVQINSTPEKKVMNVSKYIFNTAARPHMTLLFMQTYEAIGNHFHHYVPIIMMNLVNQSLKYSNTDQIFLPQEQDLQIIPPSDGTTKGKCFQEFVSLNAHPGSVNKSILAGLGLLIASKK